MKELIKKTLWLIPIIGIGYVCLCSFSIEYWFDKPLNVVTYIGLFIQILSVPSLVLLISILF